MADDVKVKFSGDFSGVAKGAGAAVKNAGSAMSSWFREYGKSIEGSILSSLTASAVFGKLKDNVTHALEYFRELDLTIRRVGGSSSEFQKLAGVGKQVGVSMEMVGRSVNFLNKYLGQAAQGSKSHQESLSKMGFTTEEIASGTISAIEVISRLGDEYDRTGNDTIVAAKAMEMFGRSGASLIPIIKMGREELKEMTKDMKVYSEETIRSASETQKNIEKMERAWGKFGKSMVEAYSNYFQREIGVQAAGSVFEAQLGGGTTKQQTASATAMIMTQTEGSRTALVAALDELRDQAKLTGYHSKETLELINATADAVQKKITEIDKPKTTKANIMEGGNAAGGITPLTVSSLQAIGGGDVSSIMAGTYQDTMLSQTQRIADATVKTAENTQPTPFQQPRPMPATK